MLKDIFNSGKCLIGFHQGDWAYDKSGECGMFQICTHCQKRSLKVEHTWSEWVNKADHDCTQTRVCIRCNANEEQTVHSWGTDAYYTNDGECDTFNYCERCRAEKPYGVVHVWKDWIYINENACDQIQQCSRCGTTGTEKRVEHNWEGWQESNFYKARVIVCRHCGLMPLNFNNTIEYATTMQDAEILFSSFSNAVSLEEVANLLRSNQKYFEDDTDPVVKAYMGLFSTHMPDGELKNAYSQAGALIAIVSTIGVDSVAARLSRTALQSGQTILEAVLAGALHSPENKPQDLPQTQSQPMQSRVQSNIDQRLFGHWRHTDVLGGGEMSLVTDYNNIFRENGRFEEYTVNAGMGSERQTRPDGGKWSAMNDMLSLRFDDGRNLDIQYYFDDGSLVFETSGGKLIFDHVR